VPYCCLQGSHGEKGLDTQGTEVKAMTRYQILKLTGFGIVARAYGGRIECCVPSCSIRALMMLHLDHINNDGCR